MGIDWTKPIEAYTADGRVSAVTVMQADKEPYQTNECPDGSETNEFWYANGNDYCTASDIWRIRNIATPIPVDIAERAITLVTDIAERRCVASEAAQISARAILDALKPVDPDDEEANAVVERYELATNVKMSGALNNTVLSVALAAIKRGRELERGGE